MFESRSQIFAIQVIEENIRNGSSYAWAKAKRFTNYGHLEQFSSFPRTRSCLNIWRSRDSHHNDQSNRLMQKWGKQASLRNSYTPLAADYLQKRRIRGHQAAPTCRKPHFRTDPPLGNRQSRNTQNYLNWWWHHRITFRRPQRTRNWKISQNRDE